MLNICISNNHTDLDISITHICLCELNLVGKDNA